MVFKSVKALIGRVGRLGQLHWSTLWGSIVALCVPLLAILLGYMVAALVAVQRTGEAAGSPVRLTPWLPDLQRVLPAQLSPLTQISALLIVALAVLILAAVSLYLFYQLVQRAAVEFEVSLIRQLRSHAKALATNRTLSAQQTALTDCLDYHLPRVRASLNRWWRVFPRHAIQTLACVAVALAMQPALGLLTLTAAGLVAVCYRALDRWRRTRLPVVRERAAQERQMLVDLSLQGPLLESVHDAAAVEKRFSDQLTHYRQDAVRSLTSSVWKTPALLVAAGGVVCLFLFVVAVHVLRSETGFSIAGALAFCLCVAAAAVSTRRLIRAWRDLQSIETAADELESFLALPVNRLDDSKLKSLQGFSRQIQLQTVTVHDSRGRKLLENVSVEFKPGQLVGVLASGRLQARALVELLMGMGRPSSGRLLFDGVPVDEVKPNNVTRCAHWIASDGALVAGSVQDNLQPSSARRNGLDLNESLARSQLTEAIRQLPDGLATLISPGDDRLMGDTAFRLAIARAALTKASMFVMEEPAIHYDAAMEQQTLDAMRSLISPQAFTIVLPQRLLTLRQCDVLVMLHDHQLVACGTHAELLQQHELYRHLNYLRFNPFRGIAE